MIWGVFPPKITIMDGHDMVSHTTNKKKNSQQHYLAQ